MNNLPEVKSENVERVMVELEEALRNRELPQWINTQLSKLSEENPSLYQVITDRSKNFAVGAAQTFAQTGDAKSLMLSAALESLILIKILSNSIAGKAEVEAFSSMMGKLLKGEKLEGLDRFFREKES